MDRQEIGNKGEEIATQYLMEQGYEILERNWRYSKAEIDVIAKKNDVLIFIEVRTKTSTAFGEPEVSISRYKQELIFSGAMRYMELTKHDWEIRFDIIAILVKEKTEWKNYDLKHIEDVYY